MKTGLVSVTFRQLDPLSIIQLVKQAGLDGIEWGSDIHVPVGDHETARQVADWMRQYNLETISYGSYYRVGVHDNFEEIVATALLLGTKNIRVWAGNHNSEDYTSADKQALIADAKRICTRAKQAGMTVSFEYHGGTYTNTQASTLELLDAIGMDNNYTYWQPLANATEEQRIANVKHLSDQHQLKNIHLYHWAADNTRYLLEEGKALWQRRLQGVACEAILMEFVKDDTVENFEKDVTTMKEILA